MAMAISTNSSFESTGNTGRTGELASERSGGAIHVPKQQILPKKQIAKDSMLEHTIVQTAQSVHPLVSDPAETLSPLLNMTSGVASGGDGVESTTGTTEFLRQYVTTQTRLERLGECFTPIPWDNPAEGYTVDVDNLPSFPAIVLVSRAFRLNFWQYVRFGKIARHVLYSYRQDIELASESNPTEPAHADLELQLIAYLWGEAGAGNSTVVHALLHFAQLWGRDGFIETLAFTGVAAINVNGKTIHSARNHSIHENQVARLSAGIKKHFSCVVLRISDGISTTDQALLGRADAMTSEMSVFRDRVWGGRHLALGEDWFQIPPVGSQPRMSSLCSGSSLLWTAFQPPGPETKASAAARLCSKRTDQICCVPHRKHESAEGSSLYEFACENAVGSTH